MAQIENNPQLEILAKHIVDGSTAQKVADFRSEVDFLRRVREEELSDDEIESIQARCGLTADKQWQITPLGIQFYDGELEPRFVGFTDFIGEIAVYGSIEPKREEIDTVIFYIGKLLTGVKPHEELSRKAALRSMFSEG